MLYQLSYRIVRKTLISRCFLGFCSNAMQRYEPYLTMQKWRLLFLGLFLILWHIQPKTGLANNSKPRNSLHQADSLFSQKKFNQALHSYESLRENGTQETKRMLFRMAFLYEKQSDIPQALLVLNSLYNQTGDQAILERMTELAEKHELQGYDEDLSTSFHRSFIRRKRIITYTLLGLSIACCGLFGWLGFQYGRHFLLLIPILPIGLTALVINKETRLQEGILLQKTIVMNGPSGASPMVQSLSAGHRFFIDKEVGPWYQVRWNTDQTAYIRKTHLQTVR